MRSLLIAAGATVVALAAAVPASGSGTSPDSARVTPTAAVVTGDVYYGCFGCGPTSISFRGTVQAGHGDLPIDEVVTATGTADVPRATCVATETATGTLAVDGEPYAAFTWTRTGSSMVVRLSNGGAGTAAARVPAGSCGRAASVPVTFTLGVQGSSDPGDATYPDTACLATESGSVSPARVPSCVGVSGVAVRRDTGEIVAGGELVARALGISSHTQAVVGIEYKRSRYRGSSALMVAQNPYGCAAGASYVIGGLGSSWNDQISSARSYSGCWGDHYDGWNLTGALLTCNCSTMGAMDNNTSSIRWRP